jgi:replicative DNA helicase
VLVLANKADIVARHHLMYSAGNGEHFKGWSVLTLEKNRSGSAGAELEFRKDFGRGRFVPDGSVVTEKLVDERVFVE